MIIADIEQCRYKMEHPAPPTVIPGPDGSLAPVVVTEFCPLIVVPPTFFDLVRGRIVFEDVGLGMKVNPYSLRDMLLGNYTLGPGNDPLCVQSATTTPCATLEALTMSGSSSTSLEQ